MIKALFEDFSYVVGHLLAGNEWKVIPVAVLVFLLVLVIRLWYGRLRAEHLIPTFLWAIYTAILFTVTLLGREGTYDSTSGIFTGWSLRRSDGRYSFDTLYNMVMFTPWTFLAAWAFPFLSTRGKSKLVLLLTGLSLCFSLLIECVQLLTARGAFQISDLVYNALSGLLGVLIFLAFQRLFGKKEKEN
ncbi:MAG: VanZ family protein [Lachnospiraceae bacterium]|nr:VanZ family protein [Lachnospiraceae bacterium]